MQLPTKTACPSEQSITTHLMHQVALKFDSLATQLRGLIIAKEPNKAGREFGTHTAVFNNQALFPL
jgi:hypothetical protein